MEATDRSGSVTDTVLSGYLRISRAIVLCVSIAIFIVMVAVNGLEIVGRGVFGRSFNWVQEVSILGAMWIYFFAYALIAKNEEYIRVDFVANLLAPAWRRSVDLFARAVTLAFHAVVCWFALQTYRFLGIFTTSVLHWPESLFVLPILLGAADIVVTEAIFLYWQIVGRSAPHAPSARAEAG